MRAPALTARLTLAAGAAVVVTVVLLGASALWIVDHQLRSSLDRSLRRRAADVGRLTVSAPAVLRSPGALEAPAEGRQLSVEVVDRQGAIVARSLALGAKLLPQGVPVRAALAHGRTGFADISLDGRPMRLFAAPVAEAGGPASGGAVIVAAATDDIVRTTDRLARLLVLCAFLAALLGSAAAAVLTRRGLRPLRRLSQAAASIERTGDASARLPASGTRDEVGELAATLNRMLGALEGAQRRERRFLADASHELRTPLTSLSGNLDFLARHGASPELVEDLRADAVRLQRLVVDLLALEREDGAEEPSEPVRVDELVGEAARARPGVQVARLQPVTVLGEAPALRRAVDNLLDNAEVHGRAPVSVAVSADDGVARVAVRDAGPGIDADDLEHVFERFWRGAPATGRPGSGLGLAIVRATAERHHGTVDVDGSAVSLVLPLAPTAS
jgi:signal transduction histidine kinase